MFIYLLTFFSFLSHFLEYGMDTIYNSGHENIGKQLSEKAYIHGSMEVTFQWVNRLSENK